MISAGGRCLAALAVMAALAVLPASASAQVSDPREPVWHDFTSGPVTGTFYPGDVLAYLVSDKHAMGSTQLVTGYFNGQAVTSLVYSHTYDRATETGRYHLAGSMSVPGAGAPVPVLAVVDTKLDRTRDQYELKLVGTFGNETVTLVDQSATNPFYNGI